MLEIFSSFLVSFSEYFPIISEKVKKGKFLYFCVRKYNIVFFFLELLLKSAIIVYIEKRGQGYEEQKNI
ncbi:hypothetical protein B0686_01490 [Streptococcus mitis]|uniref:Uncharacterized protein n=1 Tax=Streptococcus mitis TaxID=28037 RepID=A0A1T0C8M1_STRMT|nr:hypothetical protein B0686_01490 [Streptococcus mitis]